ncbi:MAG TPA: hypothetical protein VN132_08515, partial [Bdellovibrio sp.]|nr:hypothetical protein [Bdellovibrio sp.]
PDEEYVCYPQITYDYKTGAVNAPEQENLAIVMKEPAKTAFRNISRPPLPLPAANSEGGGHPAVAPAGGIR